MTVIRNLVGQRFGRLVVIERNGSGPHGRVMWLCRCDCGNLPSVQALYLCNGQTNSCGCLKKQMDLVKILKNKTHGMRWMPIYSVWLSMMDRCNNPNYASFHRYGGRGISVCKRWRKFEAFFADMGHPPPGLTLDRTDNDGNYEPSNCAWVTRKAQGINRTNTKFITLCGNKVPLTEACRDMGINRGSINSMHRRHGISETEYFYYYLERKMIKDGHSI